MIDLIEMITKLEKDHENAFNRLIDALQKQCSTIDQLKELSKRIDRMERGGDSDAA